MSDFAAATVIIENAKEEVLLLKRGATAPWMPGKWNLPGGGPDEAETPMDTATREALEETGLAVNILRYVAKEWVEGDGWVYTYHTKVFTGTVTLDPENSEYAWVAKSKLRNYDIVPGIQKALRLV